MVDSWMFDEFVRAQAQGMSGVNAARHAAGSALAAVGPRDLVAMFEEFASEVHPRRVQLAEARLARARFLLAKAEAELNTLTSGRTQE